MSRAASIPAARHRESGQGTGQGEASGYPTGYRALAGFIVASAVFVALPPRDLRLGGHFAIRPAGDFQPSRAYADQTMALETTFLAQAGTTVLTDAMAVGRN